MGEANLSSKLSLTNGVNLMIMAQVICYNRATTPHFHAGINKIFKHIANS